jgi:ABC-2 type transport system permease protein
VPAGILRGLPHLREKAGQMALATRMLRTSNPLAGTRVWVGLNTIILRECAVIARFWTVTLAPPVMTTLLYFAVFGDILGKRIGSFAGVDYIHYVAPGLIALWVIPYSFAHTAGGFLGSRTFKYLEEILVTPLPDWALMLGYVIGGVLRGLLVGAAAAITTLLFTRLHIESVLVTVAALTMAALVSSLGGFIAALFAKTFEQLQVIQNSILTPLMFVGGVFNPISALPAWAQKLALANPMLYMVDAVRYGLLGISDVPVGLSFIFMGVIAIVLFLAAVKLLSGGKGIRD